MQVFVPDPVDEMTARVRARWLAAERRRTNSAWWCDATANVPRTPPAVLMSALADEFDAYAAHRQTVDCAGIFLSVPSDGPCPESAATDTVSSPRVPVLAGRAGAKPGRDRTWLGVALCVLALALILLLVGLALGPLWRARSQEAAADSEPDNQDLLLDDVEVIADGDPPYRGRDHA
jgi:hypothetical protein